MHKNCLNTFNLSITKFKLIPAQGPDLRTYFANELPMNSLIIKRKKSI